MKEIQISFNEEVYQRIEELSDFLNIDEYKVANVSIIFGLYKYMLPYQERISKLSEQKIHKLTDDITEFRHNLKAQIEFDYNTIENLKKVERDFEVKFQDKLFSDSEEWRKQFLVHLEAPYDQGVGQVGEIEEKKKVISTLLRRKLVRKRPEKKKIIKPLLKIHLNLI